MGIINFLKNLPFIDIGTGHMRHSAKSKKIAYRLATSKTASGKTALDMGCGDGYWSEKLTALGFAVTSVDHDKYYSRTQVIDLDKALPFPDAAFGLVWSTDVLEHLRNPAYAVQEIKRILKPKGILLLTTPNSYFWLYPIMRVFGHTPQSLQNPDHKQFFSLADIQVLFPRAKIFGFFPYMILKFTISHPTLLHYLSPTFIVFAGKENL